MTTPTKTTKAPLPRLLLSADDLRDLGIRYSRAQMFKMMASGEFPRPVKISAQRSCWLYSEVLGWLEARAAERDAA